MFEMVFHQVLLKVYSKGIQKVFLFLCIMVLIKVFQWEILLVNQKVFDMEFHNEKKGDEIGVEKGVRFGDSIGELLGVSIGVSKGVT